MAKTKRLTIKQLRKKCMTEQEVKDDLWLHFGKWFYGQTGLVINGKFVYFKSDIERYKKGLPVVD